MRLERRCTETTGRHGHCSYRPRLNPASLRRSRTSDAERRRASTNQPVSFSDFVLFGRSDLSSSCSTPLLLLLVLRLRFHLSHPSIVGFVDEFIDRFVDRSQSRRNRCIVQRLPVNAEERTDRFEAKSTVDRPAIVHRRAKATVRTRRIFFAPCVRCSRKRRFLRPLRSSGGCFSGD